MKNCNRSFPDKCLYSELMEALKNLKAVIISREEKKNLRGLFR